VAVVGAFWNAHLPRNIQQLVIPRGVANATQPDLPVVQYTT
jgi:hypothetical protein